MKKAGFVAVSPFEIGDRIQCGGKQTVITEFQREADCPVWAMLPHE